MTGVKTVQVSKGTWKTLQELKLSEDLKTLDDVVNFLIKTWWYSIE